MNTKIKNFLQGSAPKKIFAVIAAVMVFSLFGNYFVQPAIVNAATTACDGYSITPTNSNGSYYTYSSANQSYSFAVKMLLTTPDYSGDGGRPTSTDATSDFTYQWSINTQPTKTVIAKQASSFSGSITGIAPATYTGTILATSVNNMNNGAPCTQTANFNITIGSGQTAGFIAKLSQDPQVVSGPDSSNNYQYRLIAELDNTSNNSVASGGTGSGNSSNGYNWSWLEAKKNLDGTTGSPTPITSNGAALNGYNVVATFPVGTYYITAVATPTNSSQGSAVSSNPTDPYGTLNVGSSANASINLTHTQTGTSGFNYQFNAAITCITSSSSSSDCSSKYTYTWTVNGTKLSYNGYNVPITLVQGTDTINVGAQTADGSTISTNTTLTVDANGTITSTEGNAATAPPSDACSSVSSSGITCIVGRVLGTLLGYIVQGITWLTSTLLLPITIAIIGIQVHATSFSAVIIQEWVFIRNFCNIFFIATLIIVGLGTLLQMSSYNLKSVLPRFVIAALLVNFSLAISQAILGVADTFQAQFLGSGGVNPQSTVILQNLAYRLMVAPLANITSSSAAALTGVAAAVITEFIYFLIALVAVFVFVALTAFLVIRIIALWLLLMSSPIAYAAWVVPIQSIKKASSQWWSNFLKYAFFTPIIALLLHICGLMADAQSTFTAGTITNFATNGVSSTQTLVTDILSAVLVAACMGASLAVAKSMGIKGADQVMKSFDNVKGKIFGAPKVVAGYGADYAGGLANRWRRNLGGAMATDAQGNPRGRLGRVGNMLLNPDAMLATTKANFEEKNKTAKDLAEARAQRFSGFNQTGVDKRNDISAMQKKRDEKTSQFMNFDRDTLAKMQSKATDNETKMQILAARAKLGYLKRDAQGDADSISDGDFRDYALSTLKGIPPAQQKEFIQQTFDKLGEDKKDLSMVGWSEFQTDGAAGQEQAQKEKLRSWGPDDMAKVKPGALSNKNLQDEFTKQVAKFDVADNLNSGQLKTLSDENLATLIPKMAAATIAKIDTGPDKSGVVNFGSKAKAAILAQDDADLIAKLPQKTKEAFKGAERGQLVTLMHDDDAVKLSAKYVTDSAEAITAMAAKIEKTPSLVDKVSKDILKPVLGQISSPDTKKLIEVKLGTSSATATAAPTAAVATTAGNSPIVDSSGRPFSKDNPPRDSNPPRFTKTF